MHIHVASIPSFVALILNLYVLLLILTKDYRKRISPIFSVLIGSFVIWDIFEFCLRNTVSPGGGVIYSKLIWTSVAFFAPLYLNFALFFPKEKPIIKYKWLYVIIYLPALITLYFIWGTNLFISGTKPLLWGGASMTVFGPYLNFYNIYAYPLFSLGLWLFFDAWKYSKVRKERMQGKWMFFASLIPIAGGSLTNVILPSMGIVFFQMATTLTVIMSLMIVYAISRYNIISVNPNFAAETIITMLPHAILLLDKDQKILYVNNVLLQLLGYKKEDLLGENVRKILHEDERVFGLAWQQIKDSSVIEKNRIKFLSSDGQTVNLDFSGAVAMDGEDMIGFIGIGMRP